VNKKLLAVLGVLVMMIPGVALAQHQSVTQEVVEGHTVYATVVQETNTQMAAIAGIAAKRVTLGGVLWFNNQELLPSSVASEIAAGAYVIGTEAGDDDPFMHINSTDLSYAESYQFTDPNDRTWVVDRYTYQVCTVSAGGADNQVPCEATAANQGVDVDGDGVPDVSTNNPVQNATKSIYVAEIGATTKDTSMSCDPLAANGGGTGKDYNFVMLVRMDTLSNVVQGGKQHGASSTDTKEQGNSHSSVSTPPADHAHDTGQIDLWFSEFRPPAPATRTLFFPADTVGSSAPCAA
jgi:hypothetical protein